MARVRILLLLAALPLQVAAASQGSGSFVAQGDVVLPAGAQARLEPLALVLNDTAEARDFELRAPSLVLTSFRRTFTAATLAGTYVQSHRAPQEERIVLHDVEIRLDGGDHRGWLALAPLAGGVVAFSAVEPATLRPQDRTVASAGGVGTQGLAEAAPGREPETHWQTIEGPHVQGEARGRVSHQGSGMLKVHGLDLQVRSAEGVRLLRTGYVRQAEGAVHEGEQRWVHLQFSSGAWSLDAPAPWLLAAKRVETTWNGTARFHPIAGAFATEDTRYVATGEPARLSGALEASLEATRAPGTPPLTRLDVRGEVSATTLAPQALPPGRAPAGAPVLSVGLTIVGASLAAAAGGYGWATWRRRAAGLPRAFSAEECLDAGYAAAAVEDWGEAVEWLSRARRLAPTSARVCADLGFALSQLDEHDAALRLFEEASRLSTDGEADFNGALAALRAGRPPEEVEVWVARALARSPEHVLHVEEDDEFQAFASRPAFRAAVRRAWGRLERERRG